jgi:chemotaxis protein MotB
VRPGTEGGSGSPTVIIKRVRRIAVRGHHGGAWKVAYADFVTAMMAFFLLMWLLNATTEDQRKGLADYFNPSIPISRISGGGAGALDGSTIFTDEALVRDGVGAKEAYVPSNEPSPQPEEQTTEDRALGEIEDELRRQQAALDTRDLADHIQVRMTPDGLLIELVEQDGEPLFGLGSSTASATFVALAEAIAPVLAKARNDMVIVGHTDARSYGGDGYSNWELSSARAHAARRLLVAYGAPEGQIVAVTGKAAREPIADDPYAAVNRRIAILLLSEKPARDH